MSTFVQTELNAKGVLSPHQKNTHGAAHLKHMKVEPRVFAKYQKLIYEKAGIWLAPHKTALLAGRLARRLRQLELEDLDQYFDVALRDPAEMVFMIDAITTNETHFFREPKHFEFLSERMVPRWQAEAAERLRPKTLRIWSAGCSTGEEPYTLAMLLLEHFPRGSGWEIEILATDISTKVLEKAQAGIYSSAKAAEIPSHLLNTYMFKGCNEQEGLMKVSDELKKMIKFEKLNLNEDHIPVNGVFDAIFCRNVLIYFDADSKKKVVNSIIERLAPEGLFFVGHAENLHGVTSRVKSLAPTVYGWTGSDGRLLTEFRRSDFQRADVQESAPHTELA